MVNFNSRTNRETGYYQPLALAEHLIITEQPIPYDLEEQLVSQGVVVDELRDSLLKDTDGSLLVGFSLA